MKLQIHPNSAHSKKYLYPAESAKNATSKPIQLNTGTLTKKKIRKGNRSVSKGNNNALEGNATGLALGN